METQGDIDIHVVKMSAKFKITMDNEITKLFYACNCHSRMDCQVTLLH